MAEPQPHLYLVDGSYYIFRAYHRLPPLTNRHGVPAGADPTVELITHRFTAGSKAVLRGWYPGSALAMDEADRARKTTKFGSTKFVHPAPVMRELRAHLEGAVAARLPRARLLYWT